MVVASEGFVDTEGKICMKRFKRSGDTHTVKFDLVLVYCSWWQR